MAEAGRPMYLLVGVVEESDIDAEALAEAVIASLELKDPWGAQAGASPSDDAATQEADAELEVYVAPRERYAFVFPADWEHHATEVRFSAGPSEGEMPRLLAVRVEYEEPTVDAVVERVRDEIPAEPTVDEVEVPGARAARRLSWVTEDLANETVLARHAEGFYILLTFAWDTDDPPDPALVETVLSSLELADDASAQPET